ncbi:Na(+)/citrate cotransporter-like isoform X1 [Clavelina lepadiformis]|uniref:Na(+)/citrate cotransporter-like isoform X1 n=2 Tax=Clavelina lepadiformis TaxID=159417 RepID=UPI004041521F
MKFLSALWRYRSTLVFLLTPIVLLAVPLAIPGKEALCGYCMILMGVYWMTEVIPLAITSFIPLILFPLFGIMTADDVSRSYLTNTNWLFVGGLTIALAVETTNLHKRISLKVLTLVGANPRCLMFGFMVTTFFLSMWISNTATTAMLLPIVEAVIKELTLERGNKNDSYENHSLSGLTLEKTASTNATQFYKSRTLSEEDEIETKEDVIETTVEVESQAEVEPSQKQINAKLKMKKGLTLCVPYAASIGGTATLTGTGPNLVLSGQFPILFPDAPPLISFANWFAYCLPSALVFFLVSYFWISSLYLGFSVREYIGCIQRKHKTQQEINANRLLKREYKNLGPIKWSELTVLLVFVTTALLWFFREPGFMPGWAMLFEEGYVDDGTVAIGMASLLFFLPDVKPMFLRRKDEDTKVRPVGSILKWSDMKKFPWNVVLLLGGGFALAEGATESGLSQWLGDELGVLEKLDTWLISFIVTIILCAFTEFTSNVATASLFVPILATLAQTIQVHPLYLLIPPVLATSLAFMLPVATPPNAIAFSYGRLKVIDMIKAGAFMNILGIATITIFINTYGVAFFHLNEFPDWAVPSNTTQG